MIKTVIFDLDGTLIDTEASAANAIQSCFASWGIQVDSTDAAYITGRTWATAFTYLFQKYTIPVGPEEASRQMMNAYRKGIEEELIIVPGAVEAVVSLSERYPLGLVSGSNRSEILWALGKLGVLDRFQLILGAEDYPQSKPAPDGYLKAIGALKTTPDATLIFEDSHAGITSARNAGTWVVAITGTNHFRQDTSQAHHHIPDLRDVTAGWVAKLLLA